MCPCFLLLLWAAACFSVTVDKNSSGDVPKLWHVSENEKIMRSRRRRPAAVNSHLISSLSCVKSERMPGAALHQEKQLERQPWHPAVMSSGWHSSIHLSCGVGQVYSKTMKQWECMTTGGSFCTRWGGDRRTSDVSLVSGLQQKSILEQNQVFPWPDQVSLLSQPDTLHFKHHFCSNRRFPRRCHLQLNTWKQEELCRTWKKRSPGLSLTCTAEQV